MQTILVTAKDGQLGQCIQSLAPNYSNLDFVFKSSSDLDITNKDNVNSVFNSNRKFDYCINCAAYTAVDKAEGDVEKAYDINRNGAKNLAEACYKNKVILIHVSTDFVFDGKALKPYLETDITNPLGIYGETKLQGEITIKKTLENHFIVRTSWLYSEFGNNFVKTMLRLSNDRNELSVVDDQKGSPTYAMDLAGVLLAFIETDCKAFGTYHYSNKGEISWFDFAKEIFKQAKCEIILNTIETKDYSTPAKRPEYSVLNSNKIQKALSFKIPNWKNSLSDCLLRLGYEK